MIKLQPALNLGASASLLLINILLVSRLSSLSLVINQIRISGQTTQSALTVKGGGTAVINDDINSCSLVMFATDNDDTSTTSGRASTTAAWNCQKDAARHPDTPVQLSTVPSCTAEERYRTVFFQLVDVTATRLAERFDPASSGLSTYA